METGCVLCEAGNELTLCLVAIKVLRTQWNQRILQRPSCERVDQSETGRSIG